MSLASDLKTAVCFYTRLPLRHGEVTAADVARASWAAPLAGIVVGAIGAAVYVLAREADLDTLPAAGLAVAATIVGSGGLHEDGLADTADAFGAGATPERRLAIMRDSRIGTYGACALILSIGLRWAALASVEDPLRAVLALPARVDGLSAGAGKPPSGSVAVAVLMGAAALWLGLGWINALIALVPLLLAVAATHRLAMAKIGGQTGDVLGALEQIAEVLVLLVAARS
jgi:adenosylcobinamide-GDP ribazoletransferase